MNIKSIESINISFLSGNRKTPVNTLKTVFGQTSESIFHSLKFSADMKFKQSHCSLKWKSKREYRLNLPKTQTTGALSLLVDLFFSWRFLLFVIRLITFSRLSSVSTCSSSDSSSLSLSLSSWKKKRKTFYQLFQTSKPKRFRDQ